MPDTRTRWPGERQPSSGAESVNARIDGRILHKTEKAIAIRVGQRTVWLPLSLLFNIEYEAGGDDFEIRIGQMIRTVEIPEWLAEKNNLEEP